MPDQHLKLHSSGHLSLHSSGHLKLWSNPVWNNVSATTTNWGGYSNFNPTSTKSNIDLDPYTTAYPTALAAALSSLASGSTRETSGSAAVGASMGRGGAARATVAVGAVVLSFVPAAVSTAARIAVSAQCQIGVFNAAPSKDQILAASQFTPSGGYVDLYIFQDIINACATDATTCYISVCRAPLNSLTGSYDQSSYYNDTGSAFNLWDWCPIAAGETVYWKSGANSYTLPLSVTGASLYY